jgi:hypothetical protein
MARTTKTTNARKANMQTRVFPIVLKTIIDDAMREKTINDDNAKKIRAKLRVAFRETHAKNTSWVATNSREYDAIRCAFDARYNERLIASRKRSSRKANAKMNDDATTTTTNENA